MLSCTEFVVNELKLVPKQKESASDFSNRVVLYVSNLPESQWDTLPEPLQEWYNQAAEVISADENAKISPIPGYAEYVKARGKKPEKVPEPEVIKAESPQPGEPEEDDELEEGDEEPEEDEDLEEVDEDEGPEEPNDEEPEEEAKQEPRRSRGRPPKSGEKKAKPEKVKKERVKKERVKKEKPPREERGPIAANVVRELLCENMDLSIDGVMEKLAERGVHMQRSSCQVVHLNTVRAFQVANSIGEVKDKDGAVVLTTP